MSELILALMTEILAQAQTPDWTAVVVQGGVGAIAVMMLRWFMTTNDARLRAFAEANDRMSREISESNDRMGRAHLLLVIALHGVNEAAKIEARTLIAEIDEAQKLRDLMDAKKRSADK